MTSEAQQHARFVPCYSNLTDKQNLVPVQSADTHTHGTALCSEYKHTAYDNPIENGALFALSEG